jgi:hypothetical protein
MIEKTNKTIFKEPRGFLRTVFRASKKVKLAKKAKKLMLNI